ncbi:MAG: zinc-binding dehydrogenase [Candidatus Hadarchaeaceae archaeon]
MKAAVLHKIRHLIVEEIDVPEIKSDEVLIKVKYAGICGTDPHIYTGKFPVPNLPLVPGHEFSGEITRIGEDVTTLKEGDRVTADINISCETCYFCRKMQKLFCPNLKQIGVHTNGAFAEYVKAPAKQIHKLPDDMLYKHGACVEPLACAIHGMERGNVQVGNSVVIIGAGPMGLMHLQLARLRGAYPVIITELSDYRLEKAEELGADYVIDASKVDVKKKVKDLTDGRGSDVVIEAVGSLSTYEQAFGIVRRGGNVVAFGAAPKDAKVGIKPFDIYSQELTITGSYAGTYETWLEAITLINSQRVKVDPLLTHVLSLDQIVEGYDMILEKKDKAIKILISPEIK